LEKQSCRVVPEADATEEAGKLVQRLPELWSDANLQERHKLLITMLDAVYVDHKEDKAVVAIQPKPAFREMFQVATTRAGSGVVLIKEPPDSIQKAHRRVYGGYGGGSGVHNLKTLVVRLPGTLVIGRG